MKKTVVWISLVGSLFLYSTACSLAAGQATSPTSTVTWPTKAWPTGAPASVGLDEETLKNFDADISPVGEGFGQNAGVVLNQVENQPIFPCVERGGGNESGLSGEGCGLPDDEAGLPAETGAAEVLRPVEAGGVGSEVGLLPGVVRLMDVPLIRQGNMFFGDGVLQFDDVLSADVRVGKAGQLEHR